MCILYSKCVLIHRRAVTFFCDETSEMCLQVVIGLLPYNRLRNFDFISFTFAFISLNFDMNVDSPL